MSEKLKDIAEAVEANDAPNAELLTVASSTARCGSRSLHYRGQVNRMKPVQVVPRSLKAGTMMVQEGLLLPKLLEMETEAYSRGWRSVKALDSFSLGQKLAAVGWHLFFVAGHVTTIAFGRGGDKALCTAVRRIATKVRALDLNCLELTEIVRKHFLGIPYVAISAQSFHIQKGWQLQSTDERQRSRRDADWARG